MTKSFVVYKLAGCTSCPTTKDASLYLTYKKDIAKLMGKKLPFGAFEITVTKKLFGMHTIYKIVQFA